MFQSDLINLKFILLLFQKSKIMPRTSSNSTNRKRPTSEQSPGPPRRQLRIITSPTPPPVESLQEQQIQDLTNATLNTNPESQVDLRNFLKM
ncbi:unnamed protein product [Meloidogyne enterolobii]|uniref:Uncharacterized protein n=1 Tax=Meloidogyne enterolobii TaxID=390850 RepID=A0ACB1AYP8_MELEN